MKLSNGQIKLEEWIARRQGAFSHVPRLGRMWRCKEDDYHGEQTDMHPGSEILKQYRDRGCGWWRIEELIGLTRISEYWQREVKRESGHN